MHYFIGLVIISVCFNIDVRIYGTLLFLPAAPPPFFPSHPGFFVILILMYAFIVLVLYFIYIFVLIVKWILMLIMYSAGSL